MDVNSLRDALSGLADVVTDLAAREAALKDSSWVSPVITRTQPRRTPAAVVVPHSVAGVQALARWAFAHDVPVVPRGKGTSNYGQSVSLVEGVVLDLTRLVGEPELVVERDGGGDGAGHVEFVRVPAGTRFDTLIDHLEPLGRELASFPTTLNSTVAGWVGGGSGGVGGLEFGLNHEGVVRELTLVGVDGASEPLVVRWPDTAPHTHAYGTTGVIVSVGLRVVPARDWTSLFASVPDLDTGAALALDLLQLHPAPRVLAVTEAELAALFPEDPGLEPGAVNVRVQLSVDSVPRARDLVERHGGRVTSVRADANRLLATLVNNHTTVRAKAARPDLFHVLVRGDAIVGRRGLVESVYPGASLQLEGGRVRGERSLSGRILAPFVSAEAVTDGMRRLAAEGIEVDDPHSWVCRSHLAERWPWAERLDPKGLLNPGKLEPLGA
ncbi:FAD-binding oxidoreductase [Kineococcus rhizosphaerae]|uniref:FAD/FMN-containing dehydrogenase n=1 Tax=Kineococcus rhizosphaerae TaxID=559628 RepID=A0A2T0QY22_9ACTN|nr:FAD-binding protein [Kineococcus rhizosphaerae]PRY11105.1 FAD/FMN-containing dehydrogenase [Kineococcus rhizosphaerae]